MANEVRYSYVDPLFPESTPPSGKTMGDMWIPFTPYISAYGKNKSWRQKSAYGGHTLALNKDQDAYAYGHWTKDDKVPTDRARNEYNIFGSDKTGTGPSFREIDESKLFASYPAFGCSVYFGKGSSDGGRGAAWSVISKWDGCLTDVAGIKIDVSPCAGNKTINEDGNETSTGGDSGTHGLDWQFNQFHAIYRDKTGNYTSILMLPQGDNYDNDKDKCDPAKGQYVFRNSTDDDDSDSVGCTRVGTDSHWYRGDYLATTKHITLYLLIDKNTAVPLNSLFVGFEFSIWIGTYSGKNRQHNFQMNNCSVIPSYIAEQIRGKTPYNYSYPDRSRKVIIPELTDKNDFEGDRKITLKKYRENDFGRRKLY